MLSRIQLSGLWLLAALPLLTPAPPAAAQAEMPKPPPRTLGGLSVDELTSAQGVSPLLAVERLREGDHQFDPRCLDALSTAQSRAEDKALVEVMINQLDDGMELAEDVVTTDGAMLVSQGQEVTLTLRQRLANYCKTHSVRQPIHVLVTHAAAEQLQKAAPVAAAS